MAFPTTSLLDDFNRANNTSSLGASWTPTIESGFTSLGILSNQCYANSGFQDNYWNTSFAADQEAWVTQPALGGGISHLLARINTPGGAYNAYAIESDGGGGTFLGKILGGGAVTDISGGTGQTVANGDSFGLACIGNQISHWYKPAAGAWTLVVTATDSSITGAGNLGLQIRGTPGPTFDNFGGGVYAPVAPPLPSDAPPIGILGRGAGW